MTINWPNRITILRLLLVGPFVVAILSLQDERWGQWPRYCALIIFALMAVTDGLDGYLARKLNQETVLGRFLDPLADKVLILSSVLLLAHQGTHVEGAMIPSTVAVIAIGKDLVVLIGFCIIYIVTSQVYIDPQSLGKWCTTFQLSMVIAILLSPDLPKELGFLPRALWWIASGLAVAAIIQYYRLGRNYLSEFESADKKKAIDDGNDVS